MLYQTMLSSPPYRTTPAGRVPNNGHALAEWFWKGWRGNLPRPSGLTFIGVAYAAGKEYRRIKITEARKIIREMKKGA